MNMLITVKSEGAKWDMVSNTKGYRQLYRVLNAGPSRIRSNIDRWIPGDVGEVGVGDYVLVIAQTLEFQLESPGQPASSVIVEHLGPVA